MAFVLGEGFYGQLVVDTCDGVTLNSFLLGRSGGIPIMLLAGNIHNSLIRYIMHLN